LELDEENVNYYKNISSQQNKENSFHFQFSDDEDDEDEKFEQIKLNENLSKIKENL
jgi:hypothetical protein